MKNIEDINKAAIQKITAKKKIKDWRLSQSEDITRRQRPDLWKKYLEKKNEKH